MLYHWGQEQGKYVPFLQLIFNIVMEHLSQWEKKKEIRYRLRKKQKLLLADDMIIYIENPKESI